MRPTIQLEKTHGGIKVTVSDLPLRIRKRRGRWTAYSDPLKTLGYSRVKKVDSVVDFIESMSAFFEIHLDENTLKEALKKFGWKLDIDISVFVSDEFKPKFYLKESIPTYNKLEILSYDFTIKYKNQSKI